MATCELISINHTCKLHWRMLMTSWRGDYTLRRHATHRQRCCIRAEAHPSIGNDHACGYTLRPRPPSMRHGATTSYRIVLCSLVIGIELMCIIHALHSYLWKAATRNTRRRLAKLQAGVQEMLQTRHLSSPGPLRGFCYLHSQCASV